MAAVTSTSNGSITGGSAPSVKRMPLSGMRFSFTVASGQLSAVAINEIFTGLPVVATGQIITVTGNYGINQSGYNPGIAIAKNWTVTA